MKTNKKINLLLLTTIIIVTTISCDPPKTTNLSCLDVNGCSNTLIYNGDFEIGSGASNAQDNIDDAPGWQHLFNQTLSKGEFNVFGNKTPNACPVNIKNFASFWLHPGNTTNGQVFREGIQTTLVNVLDTTKQYKLCMQVARFPKYMDGSNNGVAKIAIYGIDAATPLASLTNTPPYKENISLYGANHSYKLGEITLDLNTLTANFITLSTTLSIPNMSIDKIFITRDDATTAMAYIAVDNIKIDESKK